MNAYLALQLGSARKTELLGRISERLGVYEEDLSERIAYARDSMKPGHYEAAAGRLAQEVLEEPTGLGSIKF